MITPHAPLWFARCGVWGQFTPVRRSDDVFVEWDYCGTRCHGKFMAATQVGAWLDVCCVAFWFGFFFFFFFFCFVLFVCLFFFGFCPIALRPPPHHCLSLETPLSPASPSATLSSSFVCVCQTAVLNFFLPTSTVVVTYRIVDTESVFRFLVFGLVLVHPVYLAKMAWF